MWTRVKSAARKAWKGVTGAVLAVLAAIGLHDAESQTATVDRLSWQAPTEYTDGTPIPAGTITGYRYAWGTAPGGPYPNTADVGNVLTVNVSRPDPGYGTRCYRLAALIGATAGEYTVERCKTVQAPTRAPGSFAVQ